MYAVDTGAVCASVEIVTISTSARETPVCVFTQMITRVIPAAFVNI